MNGLLDNHTLHNAWWGKEEGNRLLGGRGRSLRGCISSLLPSVQASPQALEAASMMRPAERAEEVPGGEGGQALQAEIRAWFQRTQAPWLLEDGVAPAWFHGFITRR